MSKTKPKSKPRFKLVEFRRGNFLWLHGVTKLPVGYVDAEYAHSTSVPQRPLGGGLFRIQSSEGYFVVRHLS